MIRTSLSANISASLILLSCMSCVNVQKTIYFNGQGNDTLSTLPPPPPTVIASHDLLSITVTSLNPSATAVFNTSTVAYTYPTAGSNPTGIQPSGYLVDEHGNIQFPILGKVTAAGLTEDQLAQTITRELDSKKLLVDPIVTIRNLNFKVTVLGEVAHPAVLNVPSEKISLLEALGMAGDISIYGRKDNVMVIREQEGKRIIHRIDLNTMQLFNSPYYYLKPNDIVYVEANKVKVAGSSRGTQMWPIVLSGLSFVAIIASYIIK